MMLNCTKDSSTKLTLSFPELGLLFYHLVGNGVSGGWCALKEVDSNVLPSLKCLLADLLYQLCLLMPIISVFPRCRHRPSREEELQGHYLTF
ncbi:hypothetical protein SDJN03_08162, partial [Cucurbita argyrosperma subsp. sororia]